MVNEDYDLELAKVVKEIKTRNAKKILIQLGEGLKPRAIEVQQAILADKDLKDLNIHFWLNSCYGKCDIPEILDSKKNDYDMLIQFGH